MIVKHLRKDFYELLKGKKVLIIANVDVDSVCATKIITELLRVDGIQFSLSPIDGITMMKEAYNQAHESSEIVIMINCGIALDIRAFFDNPKNKLIFVLDSHRPVHVANFYDETSQIRILSLNDTFEEVPAFDDIFRSDDMDYDELSSSSSESDSDDSMASGDANSVTGERRHGKKRKRGDSLERRRKYQAWVERRNELIFNYTQFSYYGPPSALVALELSWAVSRGDMQFIWWTTIALADSLVLERLHRSEYVKMAAELSHHIAREAHSQNTSKDCLKVNFENELRFYLYRHWNLYQSIKMTPYSACVMKSWSLKGEDRFHEMLGEIGFALSECRQKYANMDVRWKSRIKSAFNLPVVRDKYKFEDISVGSFNVEIGFHPPVNGFDCQLACLAVLENPEKHKSVVDTFLDAMGCLSKNHLDKLDKGIDLAKTHLTATYRQVQDYINMNAVTQRGGFLYAPMQEGAPDSSYFRSPGFLMFLAQFTQRAVIANARTKRWMTLPLVLTAPHLDGYWAFVGIKPLSFEFPKNLFGKLFETLADKMKDMVLMEFLDPHIVLVKADQREKFLQLLENCMI